MGAITKYVKKSLDVTAADGTRGVVIIRKLSKFSLDKARDARQIESSILMSRFPLALVQQWGEMDRIKKEQEAANEARRLALPASEQTIDVKPEAADSPEDVERKREERKKELRAKRVTVFDPEAVLTAGIDSWHGPAFERPSEKGEGFETVPLHEGLPELEAVTAEKLYHEILDLALAGVEEEEGEA